MSITVTVAGNPVSIAEGSFNLDDRIEERTRCSFTVIDLDGTTTFSNKQPVTVTDSTLGERFSGYVNQPKAIVLYPNPARMWTVDCVDQTSLADKKTSKKTYKNQYAGTIAVDQVQRYGSAEGLTCKAALRWDELQADWAAGTLINTTAATNATNGNVGGGDLELALSGTPYASTLTSGAPTTVAALAFFGTASSVTANPMISRQIWTGSITVAASDTITYTMWISSSSPKIAAGLDCAFSDGTTFAATPLFDNQQDISSDPSTDLSGLANDQWYTRTFDLSAFAGKTIKSFSVVLAGDQAGTYHAYFQNIFYTAAIGPVVTNIFTTTLVANNPLFNRGYTNVSLSVVQAVAAPTQQVVFTPSGSYTSVGLLKSSQVSWSQVVPDGTSLLIESSIDGQATWQTTTSGAAIPNLTPGVQLSVVHLAYRVSFSVTTDPVQSTLAYSNFQTILSPAAAATKTDLLQAYGSAPGGSSIAFSAGTLSNTQVVSNQLTLSGFSRNYASINGTPADQTFFGGGGITNPPFVTDKQLFMRLNVAGGTDSRSRMDSAGQLQNFTLECDVQVPNNSLGQACLFYRTSAQNNNNNTFAYLIALTSTTLSLGRGTNSSSGTGAFTTIRNVAVTLAVGSIHRLKAVVSGNTHTIFIDGIQLINDTDATFPNAGYAGTRLFQASASAVSASFNNFSIRPALSGTWQSAALSIASPATYGTSIVAWDTDGIPDSSCSISLQSSVDGGSTFQPVVNGGAIPNLTPGQSLTAKTLILKVTLACTSGPTAPILNGVSVCVLGQYSSSGTRVSPALSLSPVGRAATSLINWNANLPTGTSLTVATSIDAGATYQTVASAGNTITGIALQPAPVVDSFATNTSANYTQSNFSGTTGTWTWDTANSRLVGSGGANGTLVNSTALTAADNQVMADFDQADGSGIIANYQSASALYFVQIWDASGTGTQNSVKLFKRSGGVNTQLGSTAAIAFPRGNYRRFILDIQAGALTVSMDGIQIISASDGSPLAAGKAGLLLNTLVRCYSLRIQQYGQNVSALSLLTKLTLTSTDPTVTPQVLDLQAFVSSTDISKGALIPTASYVRTYVSNNLADLNQQSGTTWLYVRPDKSVVFQDRTATPAPWILDSNNVTPYAGQQQGDVLVRDLELDTSGDLYRNRQILTGVIGTSTFTEIKIGDGSTRTWNVANPLAAPPTTWTLNGQPVTFGVLGVDSGKQFYYQIGSTALTQDNSGTLLAKTDSLVIAYTGSYETEVVRDNATAGTFPGTTSQAELAAIDLTSGIVENVLDVSGLNMTVAAVQAYGNQLLQRYGKLAARTLTFMTLRAGLAPGQQLTAFVLQQQCNNVQFLITSMSISAETAEVPGGVLYWYKIQATEGANLGSWVRQLASGLSS